MYRMHDPVGQTLGQFEIREHIGEGGMAAVFKAHQASLKRDVAIKILPPNIADKSGFGERFVREAQAIGNLHHPNILPVYDFGQDKGFSYIAMRYIPQAQTLADMMKTLPLDSDQVIQLIGHIAAALDHAHQTGVVHRDVKPSNILMDKDWPYLSDFGLAKMVEMPSELTGAGVGVGTPAYMSPEQAKGELVDHRTDIYSLGLILFEMLTGQVPHKAETPMATVMRRVSDPLPSPRNLNPDIPKGVETVLLKALALDPAKRFAQAGDLAAALKAAYAEASAGFAPEGTDHLPLPVQSSARGGLGSSAFTSIGRVDIAVLAFFGLVALCGLGGVVLSFTTNAETGQQNLALLPSCLGLAFAGFTSMGLIWFRQRNVAASAWLAIGVLAWFLGINVISFGGFALANPSRTESFSENLGFSLVLCFAPGALFALLGLSLYGYDYRRSLKVEEQGGQSDVGSAQVRLPQAEQTSVLDRSESQAGKLRRAAEYRTGITNVINRYGGSFAHQFKPILAELEQWEDHLHELVERLHSFENDRILQRDLKEVPAAISRLETGLSREKDPGVLKEMKETLDRQQKHQKQLTALTMMMRRTELDIDETLAAIGAIYSQVQLLKAKDIDSSRAKRLTADIHEQADHLDDLLEAMDEVYQGEQVAQ